MKKFITLSFLFCLAVFSYQCGDTDSNSASTTKETPSANNTATKNNTVPVKGAAVFKGNIKNAANLRIFFEQHSFFDNVNDIKGSGEIDSNGDFVLQLPKIETGIYRVRIGRKRIYLPLDGGEKEITLTGDLTNLGSKTIQVTGAKNIDQNLATFSKIETRQINANNATAIIEQTANPVLSLMVAMTAYGQSPKYLKLFESIHQKIKANNPNSVYAKKTNGFLAQIKREASNPIQIGKAAPDIKLKDPNGKERALSQLKGKVVLLDFWASWCGPCRRENPNVVNIYNKYNKKGFEVFSVSLDKPNAKARWVKAIEKDGLKWPWHVSDLQGWSSAPARLYQVRSIPRTFLIDKDGNIADMNVRGPALEVAVKKLLAKS